MCMCVRSVEKFLFKKISNNSKFYTQKMRDLASPELCQNFWRLLTSTFNVPHFIVYRARESCAYGRRQHPTVYIGYTLHWYFTFTWRYVYKLRHSLSATPSCDWTSRKSKTFTQFTRNLRHYNHAMPLNIPVPSHPSHPLGYMTALLYLNIT